MSAIQARGTLPPCPPHQGPRPWTPPSWLRPKAAWALRISRKAQAAFGRSQERVPRAQPLAGGAGGQSPPGPCTVIVAAGGTAGHVFPAEALVEALRRRGWRPVVFTDRRAIEHGFGGAERHVLAGAGIAGRGLWRGLAAFGAMAAGMRAARRRMVGLRPRVVVGFGGYPSVAPVLAARLMARRPRILLHEQNAVLGRANRVLALLADRLAVSFAGTLHAPRTAVVTGNPVRAEVQGVAYAPSGEGPFSILIFGGSLGARVMADLVPEALAGLAERTRLRVVQQCRAEDLKRVAEVYAKAGIRAELASFFADVPERLAASHLVIARAGASSIAELAVSGRPAILVPLPSAIDDHQRANAGALAAAGAAIVLDQVGLTAARMGAAIASLRADPARLAAMAEAAARFGRVDAAERLADLVEALGGGA